jgi:CubicO group peptidase (beta-lactamase class C family)
MLKLLFPLLSSAMLVSPAQAVDLSAIQRTISDQSTKLAPGCAVGAFRAGKPIIITAAGMADIAAARPIDADTLFYAASISKQFTALAAAKLIESGKLRLDDDIRKYLPELPIYSKPVTVRMLMQHTSGIRDSLELIRLSGIGSAANTDKDTALRLLFQQQDTNFVPGTKYTYSNGGYLLLAEVVERLAGMPFADYATRTILKPLRMDRSMFMKGTATNATNVAHGYGRVGGRFEVRDTFPTFSGSGGLMVSINDLAKFERDVALDHKVWTPAVSKMLTAPGSLANATPVLVGEGELVYAGGLMVGRRRGQHFAQHGGGAEGFKNMYARLPARNLAVAVFCNRGDYVAQDKADQIIELIEGDILEPPIDTGAPLDGRYRSDELKAVWDIALEGDELTASISSPLARSSTQIAFKRNEDGSYGATGTRLVFDADNQGFTVRSSRIHALHFRRATTGS